MGHRAYKTTGASMKVAMRLLGVELRVTGLERLPDRPVLFVVNHFTRFETFLIPYAIFNRFDRPVHTLATDNIFKGIFGKYLRSLGVMSIRAPQRNRTIVAELMTGRANWVIYPEGGLVKSKKTVENGRLRVSRGERIAPPHTGAAVLALKAELRKRRYLEAIAADDRRRMEYYEDRYDVAGPDDVPKGGVIVVPVNITYPRLRARRNIIHRAARLLGRGLDPRLDEELQVEGTILFGREGTSVHFGDPIEVSDYLHRTGELGRTIAGWFGKAGNDDLFLRRAARRLTGRSMRGIYGATEINFDHLFCYGLRAAKTDVLPVRQFHRSLYLAALELRQRDDIRLHPVLRNGIVALDTGDPFEPLESIERLALREGVVRRAGDSYVIDRQALERNHHFHAVRLKKMVQVIANELEPIDVAVNAVADAVNASPRELASRLPNAIWASDRSLYQREYTSWHEPGVSKPIEYGEPFFLEAPKARAGVVLAHGYLACPEQIRPFAEHLHARGLSVYGVRLGGHGTAPPQLAEATWQAWLETMLQAHSALRHRCPRVIVGGFSLGGVLACMLAARRADEVDGVFTINAPVKLRHRLAPLVPAVLGVNGAMKRFRSTPEASRHNHDSESPDINYDVDYLAGIRELRRAIKRCRRTLPGVVAPTLVIQTEDDPVVTPRGAMTLHDRLGTRSKTVVWLPGDRHVIVRGDGSDAVFERVCTFVDRVCDEERSDTTSG